MVLSRTEILEKIQTESAFDIYCKLYPKPSLPSFYLDALDEPLKSCSNHVSFPLGSFIELHGPSASGKSSFLLHILCTYITPPYIDLPNPHPPSSPSHPNPPHQNRINLYGLGLSVLYIDLDLRFDSLRLHSLLYHHFTRCFETYLSSSSSSSSFLPFSSMIQDLIKKSMEKLILATPPDPTSLLHVLQLFSSRPHWSAPRIDLIMIDSLSQAFWPLKHCTGFLVDPWVQKLSSSFFKLKQKGITCIFTTWQISKLTTTTTTVTSASSSSFSENPMVSTYTNSTPFNHVDYTRLIDLQYQLQPLPKSKMKNPATLIVQCALTYPIHVHASPHFVGIHTEGLFDLELDAVPSDNEENDRK